MARLKSSKILIVLAAASFALSACGIKGSLKTPPPVWGKAKPTADNPDAKPENTDPAAEDEDYLDY